jgi:YHS domain-containing protein
LESLVTIKKRHYNFPVKNFPIIPVALALVGAGFIVAAFSGFSQRPVIGKPAEIMVDATTASYPLTTCVVSGEKLGEMGKPAVINYQGTEVRFCCAMCVDQFKKDPAKYLAKLPAGPKP